MAATVVPAQRGYATENSKFVDKNEGGIRKAVMGRNRWLEK